MATGIIIFKIIAAALLALGSVAVVAGVITPPASTCKLGLLNGTSSTYLYGCVLDYTPVIFSILAGAVLIILGSVVLFRTRPHGALPTTEGALPTTEVRFFGCAWK